MEPLPVEKLLIKVHVTSHWRHTDALHAEHMTSYTHSPFPPPSPAVKENPYHSSYTKVAYTKLVNSQGFVGKVFFGGVGKQLCVKLFAETTLIEH
jgi:hypothetical protein